MVLAEHQESAVASAGERLVSPPCRNLRHPFKAGCIPEGIWKILNSFGGILCSIEWLVSDVLGPLLARGILGTRHPMGQSNNILEEWRPQLLRSVAWIFSELMTPWYSYRTIT